MLDTLELMRQINPDYKFAPEARLTHKLIAGPRAGVAGFGLGILKLLRVTSSHVASQAQMPKLHGPLHCC